jgi:hypothetical protein
MVKVAQVPQPSRDKGYIVQNLLAVRAMQFRSNSTWMHSVASEKAINGLVACALSELISHAFSSWSTT